MDINQLLNLVLLVIVLILAGLLYRKYNPKPKKVKLTALQEVFEAKLKFFQEELLKELENFLGKYNHYKSFSNLDWYQAKINQIHKEADTSYWQHYFLLDQMLDIVWGFDATDVKNFNFNFQLDSQIEQLGFVKLELEMYKDHFASSLQLTEELVNNLVKYCQKYNITSTDYLAIQNCYQYVLAESQKNGFDPKVGVGLLRELQNRVPINLPSK